MLPAARREGNLTRDEARARARCIAGVDYRLEFELGLGEGRYRGRGELRFEALRPPGESGFVDCVAEAIDSLALDGRALDPADSYDGTRIRLPPDLAPGVHTLEVAWNSIHDTTGLGFHRFVDPTDGSEFVYTNSEPYAAHRAFPCFDQPDLKATYRLTVTAPDTHQVVANTLALGTSPAGPGRTRHEFPPSERFSTYLFCVTAGPYAVFEDPGARIPARILCRPSLARHLAPDLEALFETTRRGFDFFERFFGVPYRFAKYDQVFCPDFFTGAMENVGCVTISDGRFVFRHDATEGERLERDMVLLHELAHMWFGNLVTMDWWDGLWLNESFATWMSFVALPECTPHEHGWEYFDDKIRAWAMWQDQLPTTHPVLTEVKETRGCFANFDGITYGKGCCLLRQLAHRLGMDAFARGMRGYFARHAWGNTTTDDFLAALSEASGVPLAGWARLWLETSGMNVLTPVLELREGKVASAHLVQQEGSGDAVLRPHRVALGLYTRKGETLAASGTLRVDLDGALTAIPELVGLPPPDLLHPNFETFAYARCRLDPASAHVAETELKSLPDARARSSLVDLMRQEVLDAALPVQEFIELALQELADEEHPPLRDKLATAAISFLDAYLDRAARRTPAATLHAMAHARLSGPDLDAEARRVWLRVLIGSTWDEEAAVRISDLLEGAVGYPGVELDARQRWAAVARLVRLEGHRGLARVEAESRRDDTDLGAREALAARAGAPCPEEKRRLWDWFLDPGTGASLEMRKTGFAAFHQPDQGELAAPYVDRYLEALPGLVEHHGMAFAIGWVQGMFPVFQEDEATLARLGARLEAGDLPPALLRPMREKHDDLRRWMAVRRLARQGR